MMRTWLVVLLVTLGCAKENDTDTQAVSQTTTSEETQGAGGWSLVAQSGSPGARTFHSAVWDGHDVMIWGGMRSGLNPGMTNSGGIYDLQEDRWYEIPNENAPSARYGHCAVWVGGKMIVWG